MSETYLFKILNIHTQPFLFFMKDIFKSFNKYVRFISNLYICGAIPPDAIFNLLSRLLLRRPLSLTVSRDTNSFRNTSGSNSCYQLENASAWQPVHLRLDAEVGEAEMKFLLWVIMETKGYNIDGRQTAARGPHSKFYFILFTTTLLLDSCF